MEAGHQLYELFETAQVVRMYVDRDHQVYRGLQHKNVYECSQTIREYSQHVCKCSQHIHEISQSFFAKYHLYVYNCLFTIVLLIT